MLNIKLPLNIFTNFHKRKSTYLAVFAIVSPVILFSLSLSFYHLYYDQKIFPNVYIASSSVSGLTKQEALAKIASTEIPDSLTIYNSNTSFNIPLREIDFKYDYASTVDNAFGLYRDGSIFSPLTALYTKRNIQLVSLLDTDKLQKHLSVIAEQITEPSVDPSVSLADSGVVVNKGEAGTDLNIDELKSEIITNLTKGNFESIHANTYISDPTVSDEVAAGIEKKAQLLVGKTLVLSIENDEHTITDKDLVSFLGFDNDYNEENIDSFISQLKPSVERKPQNPIFKYADGKVAEFSPAKNGVVIKDKELKNKITQNLSLILNGEEVTSNIEIPVDTSPPDYQTSDINDMGINVLLGRGTSLFRHSIASRVHNVLLASSHFNGVLVKPGEVFSFNNTVGDVSQLTGYQQAYIIKDGKTVLGDGGGLCQVSTTLFRAALDAGLPIVERRAHSYRVGYYEQDSPPGIDATVFSPTTDLKFKNDTPNYLLIQTIADAKDLSLVFEIYGTSDGRVSNITKPIVYDVSPPPEDLYVDDPTLPEGTIKQIDWKAWGAKVKFDYSVERGGETIYEKTFYSNYRPWQSVFLRGTGPAI